MTRKEEIEKGIEYFKKNPGRMSSLYTEMYSEDVCLTCPTVDDAIKYAWNKMYEGRDMIVPTIRMKRGKVISTHMWDDPEIPEGHFTFNNTTDELAKKFIEKGYGDYFIL